MKFAVGILERFLDPFDIINEVQHFDTVDINFSGITDQTEDDMGASFGNMDIQTERFKIAYQRIDRLFCRLFFLNNDHLPTSFQVDQYTVE